MFIAKQTLNGHLQVLSTYACSDCHSLNHVLRLSTIKSDDNKMISLAVVANWNNLFSGNFANQREYWKRSNEETRFEKLDAKDE